MQKDLVVPTPSLAGSSELLVIAPIKPGFVPALDAVTYTSRARMLLRTLHAARRNAHEYNLFRAVSDAVERVGVIHSLRVAVLEPDASNASGSILLSVNFDGSYEAYVRVIWQKAARLLDLIFCNTVDHVTGWDHACDTWGAWLRSRQVDTPFYYDAPWVTKGDLTALRMQDRFQRRQADVDQLTCGSPIADAEHIAWELVVHDRDPQSGPFAAEPASASPAGEREGVRQGLQGLAGVFRLSELYVPGTRDGDLLHRAALELLPEFARMWDMPNTYATSIRLAAGERLAKELVWFSQRHPLPAVRVKPPLPSADPAWLPPRAQAGILQAVQGARRACVCLVAFDGPADAAAFLREFQPSAQGTRPLDAPCVNVALTFEGLRACGLPESTLARLPMEFRHGMQRRAGLLGDVQANHPRRWSLPVLNGPAALADPASPSPADAPTVPLQAVHALLHVRVLDVDAADLGAELLSRFEGLGSGVRPLSVQWLRREVDHEGEVVDHFGYRDGQSDPVFAPDNAFFFPNQVHVGEALVGHPNAADAAPALGSELTPLLQDASYLVVRKLRQNVDAFKSAVASVALPAELVKAKLVGRWPDGRPLVDGEGLNDFDYADDAAGAVCPFAAHIRRANPRVRDGVQANEVQALPGARPPRLFRRGMSYADPRPDGGVDKGLFFMAYNASIGEQFEVVQRWLAGGNSAGAPSAASDPLCGVPEAGRPRYFRFEHEGAVHRVALDGDDELGVEAEPLVRLAWGEYFLAPSLDGVAHLAALASAAAAAGPSPARMPWDVAQGVAEIARLRALATREGDGAALQAWKALLEDPEHRREFHTAAVWAAIRHAHGGLLRTPYGVLVADPQLLDQVLTDTEARYTAKGYQQRLADTIGEIFLGLDAGSEYDRQAGACNRAIQSLTFGDGYTAARAAARKWLGTWVQHAHERAQWYGEARWELQLDMRQLNEHVLADLLELWFGLSADGRQLMPDGFSWDFDPAQPARYPGAFYTPSRHTFQPQPAAKVEEIARLHGQHLRQRMAQFLAAHHATLSAPVTRAVLDDPALCTTAGTRDFDLMGRTIAGAIMGFVPTTDHNLRRIAEEWLRDQTLWQLRARTTAGSLDSPGAGRALLTADITRAMMLRPMPEFIWRTVVHPHALEGTDGSVLALDPGERVVLGLMSATHQGLQGGGEDLTPVFGGDRWADPAPRHACPGMHAALGVIAGVLSAIVDTPLAMRPPSAGATLSFEGPVAAREEPVLVQRTVLAFESSTARSSKGTLLGWGDSWFQLHHPLSFDEWDLARSLAGLGWNTSEFSTYSSAGLTLQEMAQVPSRRGFYSLVRRRKPLAILIDGGGNDVHANRPDGGSPLGDMAAPAGSTPPLDADAVNDFVHRTLRGHLDTVLRNLIDATEGKIPILVHGYDHPIPDGRTFLLGDAWLDPVNDRRRYTLAQGTEIMRLLIEALNTMIADAVQPFAGQGARHLNLTGTLAAQPGYANDYTRWWLNELHPTQRGYDALAAVVDTALTAALATP